MILKSGNLWESKDDIILFTANATLCKDGRLVMGAGAARQARALFPGCDYTFGLLLKEFRKIHGMHTPYGVLLNPPYGYNSTPGSYLGAFQTKWHYSMNSSLDLIGLSTSYLCERLSNNWRGATVALNFPGINNGRLERSDVLPIIACLPDSVHIHEQE